MICCFQCELQVAVDCSRCQNTPDRRGKSRPCCPQELAVYEHVLMILPKDRHYCLGCCEKDAAYLAQWHRKKDWLQKHKPCSGCAVTLVSGKGKPLRQAEQQDESPTPPPAPSNTTTVQAASAGTQRAWDSLQPC